MHGSKIKDLYHEVALTDKLWSWHICLWRLLGHVTTQLPTTKESLTFEKLKLRTIYRFWNCRLSIGFEIAPIWLKINWSFVPTILIYFYIVTLTLCDREICRLTKLLKTHRMRGLHGRRRSTTGFLSHRREKQSGGTPPSTMSLPWSAPAC
jgi:hypothetical protein